MELHEKKTANLSPVVPSFLTPGTARVGELWRIYLITRRSDGRRYVGVTCRTLAERLSAHCADALRRTGPRRRPGTIALAIREAIQAGLSPGVAFQITELEQRATRVEARRAEVAWIEKLSTEQPHGFNFMPGGASLGSLANATPVAFNHPQRGRLSFPTRSTAIAWRNAELAAQGQEPLKKGDVAWRIRDGWSLLEALGYQEHEDGRGLRAEVIRCGSRTYRSLRMAATATGISAAALRSRLHRARRAGLSNPDLAKARGRGRVPRAARISGSPGGSGSSSQKGGA